jgi:hypothetical protein
LNTTRRIALSPVVFAYTPAGRTCILPKTGGAGVAAIAAPLLIPRISERACPRGGAGVNFGGRENMDKDFIAAALDYHR